jgi:hypothetical protein
LPVVDFMRKKIKEITSILKNSDAISVLHQNLTVQGQDLQKVSDTCVFQSTFYNSNFCTVVPPFKPISRVVNIDESELF